MKSAILVSTLLVISACEEPRCEGCDADGVWSREQAIRDLWDEDVSVFEAPYICQQITDENPLYDAQRAVNEERKAAGKSYCE